MIETQVKQQTKVTAWRLFAGFFRIGAFTIGGGYVMIPIIQRDLVEKRGWIKNGEFLDLIAVAQSVPGVIAVNAAALVGFRLKGLSGALMAMLGAALPSFLIIVLVADYLLRFNNQYVDGFLAGARPAVVGLLLYATISMGRKSLNSVFNVAVFVAGLVALLVINVHPIVAIMLAGVVGYIGLGRGKGDAD